MRWTVVGGAGFVGSAVCDLLRARGATPAVVDVAPQPTGTAGEWAQADLLVDDLRLPPGRLVLAFGRSMPRPLPPWTLALDNALATARLARHLAGRRVTLLSSVEVYGSAPGPLREDTRPQLPVDAARLAAWCERALAASTEPCPPHRAARLCQDLVDLDPSGRWVYALSKAAQEEILRRVVPADQLTVLRVANVVGRGQWRVVGRLVDAVLAGRPCVVTDTARSFVSVEELARVIVEVAAPGVFNVASGALPLVELAALVGDELGRVPQVRVVPAPAVDSCGTVDAGRASRAVGPLEQLQPGLRRCVRALADRPAAMFSPSLPVVVPPRPERPDLVAERMAASLWSGRLRDDRWTGALAGLLTDQLQLGADRRIVLTNSGTNALRLAVAAVAPRAGRGDVAVCPAFTFHATAEVLRQLGYAVRLVDVDPRTWTLDPERLADALADGRPRVVVAVDTLGNSCDYERLRAVCRRARVPLVADSAAALGPHHRAVGDRGARQPLVARAADRAAPARGSRLRRGPVRLVVFHPAGAGRRPPQLGPLGVARRRPRRPRPPGSRAGE